MSDTIIIEVIKSLEAKITNSVTDMAKIHTNIALIKQTLDRVEGQTIKTNGRVTKLEDLTNKLTENNLTLTAMFSKQNGVYEQNLLNIENNIKARGCEIDELKKKVNVDSEGELGILKINTENSWKLKLAIWGTISLLLTSGVTWFLTDRIERHDEHQAALINNK